MGQLLDDILNTIAIQNGELKFFDVISDQDGNGNPVLNFADEVEILGQRHSMADFFSSSFTPDLSPDERYQALKKINPLLRPGKMADDLKFEQEKWEEEKGSLECSLKRFAGFIAGSVFPDSFIFLTSGLATLSGGFGDRTQETLSNPPVRKIITLHKIPGADFLEKQKIKEIADHVIRVAACIVAAVLAAQTKTLYLHGPKTGIPAAAKGAPDAKGNKK